jgi:hypothetical protein
VVALLVVSGLSIVQATYTGPLFIAIVGAAQGLGIWGKAHPFLILLGGAVVGAMSAWLEQAELR